MLPELTMLPELIMLLPFLLAAAGFTAVVFAAIYLPFIAEREAKEREAAAEVRRQVLEKMQAFRGTERTQLMDFSDLWRPGRGRVD